MKNFFVFFFDFLLIAFSGDEVLSSSFDFVVDGDIVYEVRTEVIIFTHFFF